MTVVCIAGMHRSGTSLVAHLLKDCGLYLGPDERFIKPNHENPDGFWENVDFLKTNEGILTEFGGGWDLVPEFPQNWVSSESLYRHQAKAFLDQFSQFTTWGWKDPRNSLTFPFWKSLIPNLKVVVVVRNPVSVARSLERRGASSYSFSTHLWLSYYLHIFENVLSGDYIITHYDTYFTNPKEELRRVLDFIGLQTPIETFDIASALIKKDLRHHSTRLIDLFRLNTSIDIIEKYLELCSNSGSVYQPIHAQELSEIGIALDFGKLKSTVDTDNTLKLTKIVLRQAIQTLTTQILEKEQAAQVLNAQMANKDQAIQELTAKVQEYSVGVANKDQAIQELTAKVQEYSVGVANKDQTIQELTVQLAERKSSIVWSIIQLLWRIRAFLIPHGSKRERLWCLIMNGFRVWRAAGFKVLTHEIFLKLRNSVIRSRKIAAIASTTSDLDIYQRVYLDALKTTQKNAKDEYVPITEADFDPLHAEVKPIAFYLPQFHPFPENDAWWGRGFTEWTNVSKAKPNFLGHYQPRLPGELGFYDLRVPEVQRRQVELARKYGIYGFCFHYYWFSGKRLLERPLNQFLADPEIDFPFCLCWANENWTRRWDGAENEILIGQTHSEDEYLAFIRDIMPNFLDNRYIRVHGKPLLIVYRVNLLPNPRRAAEIWRSACKKMGMDDIYLVAAQGFGVTDPRPYGFDAAVEFPPNSFLGNIQIDENTVQLINPHFTGRILDYGKAVQSMMNMSAPDYTLFRTVMPSWDNTARKQNDGYAFINSTPSSYKAWLTHAVRYTRSSLSEDKQFVFINAWNEWGEGAYLEPDSLYGYAYLQATADAISSSRDWTILFVSHDANLAGAQHALLSTIAWFKVHTSLSLKVLCLDGGELLPRFKALADTVVLSEWQDGRSQIVEENLIKYLLKFCGGTPDLIYGNTVVAGKAYLWLSKLRTPILTHVYELEMSIQRYAADCIADVLKYSSHFIAPSGAVRDNLIKNHFASPENITVVYGSVASEPLHHASDAEKKRLKSEFGLDPDKMLIVGCGAGMPFRKGADLFIELGRILQRKGCDDCHLYWIGEFGHDARDISDVRYGNWADHLAKLHKDGLSESVTFLAFKDNLNDYLRLADIFVLPSREDPLPLVALQAANCGLPVICFADSGGTPDLVGEDAGYVVPFEDVEAMADKAVSLMQDRDLRKALGARAREKFLAHFTVERTIPIALAVGRKIANKKPAVSVIVPNYNHAQYLPQRLDSIFNQTFQDFEVILLDDASTDNSMDVLEKYAGRGDVQILQNEHNTGSPCKQWLKGIDLARSDILWIAESDDICACEFLQTLLPAFKDPKVKLAYANSHIINDKGEVVGDYLGSAYLTSLSPTKWKTSYKVPAEQEINDGLGVKNTVLNASAVLFRKFEPDKKLRKTLSDMRIAGDWYFIAHAIKGGAVRYEARKLNYHRRHSESVIGKTIQDKKIEDFFQEFYVVQKYIFNNYQLAPEFQEKWEKYLRQQWNDFYPSRSFDDLKHYYPIDEMRALILHAHQPETE